MNIEYMPGKENTIVSVSNYGEIILSERQGNRLLSKVVFKNNKYDFRDVIVERTSGNIYAVSRTGHLVIVSKDLQNIKTIVLEDVEHPMRLHDLNDKSMLVIGERALALIDLKLLT